MKKLRFAALAAIAGLSVLAAACGGGGSKGAATGSSPTRPEVSLKDFAISAPTTVGTGAVTFSITNQGPSVHEFVVMKTNLAVADLPKTLEDGVSVLDEENGELQAVDEKEDIAPGATTSLSVALSPGLYIMFCNIPGHFEAGMVTPFTVGS